MILIPLAEARSADVPLPKTLLAPPGQNEVIPRHRPRLISRQEIFQAIQNDLAQKGISARGELRPEDLRIQSSVPMLRADTGLQVKKIGYDPIRRETVFELWTSHEPQFLPFEVTTRRNPQRLGMGTTWDGKPLAAVGGVRPTISQAMGWPASKPPVLAKPGRPATLVMLGQNVRVTTTVVPLQPGTKGQRILVRDLTTARVMSADIVDEGLLTKSF
jgi:hypothetical protein